MYKTNQLLQLVYTDNSKYKSTIKALYTMTSVNHLVDRMYLGTRLNQVWVVWREHLMTSLANRGKREVLLVKGKRTCCSKE